MDFKKRIAKAKQDNRKVINKALYPKSHSVQNIKERDSGITRIHVTNLKLTGWRRITNEKYIMQSNGILPSWVDTEYCHALSEMGVNGFFVMEAPFNTWTYDLNKSQLAIFAMITSGISGIEWVNDIDVTCY